MAKATLINPTGQKVVVESGSPEAQKYFGQGYTLMGAPAPTAPPAGMTQITAGQAGNFDIKGQVGATGASGSYLYGIPKVAEKVGVDEMTNNPSTGINDAIAQYNASQKPPEFTDYSAQIQGIYDQIQQQMESINKSTQQSPEELQMGTDLANLQTQEQKYALDTQSQIDAKNFNPNLLTSQVGKSQTQIEHERSFKAQEMKLDEANLLSRLGLAQDARKATLEAQKFGLSSLFDVAGLQMKAQDAINSQKQQVWQNAQTLTKNAQDTLANILERFKGVDPDKLSASATAQLTQLAQQAGIDPQLVFAGMKSIKDQIDFDQMYKMAELANKGDTSLNTTDWKNYLLSGGDANDPKGFQKWLSGNSGMTEVQSKAFSSLADKYIKDPIISQYDNSKSSIAIAEQVLAAPDKATNQLKTLYLLVKNLDPTSAVREGELGLAQSTQSYLDKFETSLTRIAKGQVLSPKAATALAEATIELFGTWELSKNARDKRYAAQAEVSGFGDAWKSYQGFNGATTTGKYTSKIDEALSNNWSPDDIVNFLGSSVDELRKPVEDAMKNGYTSQEILDYLRSFSSVGGDTNKATAKVMAIPNGSTGGQCGRFVNNVTGLGVGDTYQSKISKMNPAIKVPSSGMVFVMPYKNTGHTGIILSVNNGIATVKDSNWNLDGKIITHKIPVSKMTGFNYV